MSEHVYSDILYKPSGIELTPLAIVTSETLFSRLVIQAAYENFAKLLKFDGRHGNFPWVMIRKLPKCLYKKKGKK